MAKASFDYTGEQVLVTGASRGIGYAVALGFARAGASVTVLSSGSGIHAAATRIAQETGRSCAAVECDITDSAAVKASLGAMGRIDVLVPKMQQGGRIVLTASIWSRVVVAEFAAYIASKHANLGFTRVMAKELGPRGIRVNAVCPGWVRTEAALLSLKKMSLSTGRSEADLLAEITGAQVLPGLLEPEDMVPLYLFLASDAARDITGQAMMLDRGEVMA